MEERMPKTIVFATKGHIINNGHYDIMLLSDPIQDDDGRWLAKGRRWVRSRKAWEEKPATYGWVVAYGAQQGSQP